MYNAREALAYSGKLPEQQNQAAISSQLLDILALQKVEADKNAAARALAMQSGQALPTVAEGLKQRAMQSARQEIAQKMGIGALLQAQPPAGPMPQPQGLMGAPTNLPTEYQGGGIIAFAQGGSGGDAHGRYRSQSNSGGDAHGRYQNQDEVAPEQVAALEEAVAPEQVVASAPVVVPEQAAAPQQAAPSRSNQGNDQAPRMSAEDAAFIRGTQNALLNVRKQDPSALGMEEVARQQEMLSPNREAAIARKRDYQAGLKELYERQKTERPSDLQVALRAMGRNINRPGGLGAAMLGVEESVTGAKQDYTNQELAQLSSLNTIDNEIDNAIAANDVDKYNAYVARKKEVQGEINKSLESSTTMSDVLAKVQAGKENVFAQVEEKKRAAIEADLRKREAASAENVRKLEIAAMQSQTALAIASQMTASRELVAGLVATSRSDAAALRDATLRYQIDKNSTDRFIASQARAGQADAAREEGRIKMRLDAVEKAARMVEDDPLLKFQPANIKEDAIRQRADIMINAAQAKPNAPAATAKPTTRLKFDAKGNPIN